MDGSSRARLGATLFAFFVFATLMPVPAAAHCDGVDGPVVKAALEALNKEDVRLVLVWVRKQDAEDVRRAFESALSVRRLSPDARKLADTYFFETVVRVHRAGEGAPYTGLKPSGRDLGPAIPLADEALRSGNPEALVKLLTEETRAGLIKAYEAASRARHYAVSDVDAGRQFVRAYVEFIHYVERAHEAVAGSAEGHYPEQHDH